VHESEEPRTGDRKLEKDTGEDGKAGRYLWSSRKARARAPAD
jgi:hypothetical protein